MRSRFIASDLTDPPAPVPDAYLGVWRRTLLETAGWRDEHSQVWWLQTPRWHADLRLPVGRPEFSGISSLAECDDMQLAWLATQHGFCGLTQVDGDHCTWHRQMDFQPANGNQDVAHMIFDGERVIETGIESDYREIWQRLPHSQGGTAALQLVVEYGELPPRTTRLFVAGDYFVYVRDRRHPLPSATDLTRLIAQANPSRSQLIEWLNVEISLGRRSGPAAWRIEHSTLPFREGQTITQPGAIQRRGHPIAIEGNNEKRWMILDWSLNAAL